MAGWFQNGVCYAVQQQAIDAHYQAIQPSILNTSTVTYKTQYIKQANGSFNLVKQTYSATGVITNNYSVSAGIPVQNACDDPTDPTSNFLNGMELGWAVATVMVIVFAIRRSYRGF